MGWMRVIWALSGAWLWIGIASVSAQPSDAEARSHFEAGTGYFEAGDYAAAVRAFERAHELSSHPPVLYYLYAAHERLGHVAQAADYLEQYLRSGEEVEQRDALEGRLASLKGTRDAASASGAEAPAPTLAASPPSAPAGDEPPEVSERFMQSMGMFAVAGAGAITLSVAGALALQEDDRLAKRCGRDVGRTCSDDDVSGLRTRMMVADIGLGLTVVGALAGLTLWWIDRRESARRGASLRPAASADAHGAQLVLGGRF